MTTEGKRDGFETWAIVELMGHQALAGHVSEQQLAGTTMLRVDVPETDGHPAFTRLVGAAAIYALTPVSESVARLAVATIRARPFTVYVPPVPQLAPVSDVRRDDGTWDFEEDQ